MPDSDHDHILEALSAETGSGGLTRRTFLRAGAAGFGGALIAPLLSHLDAFAAPPVAAHEGIVVLVTLDGGNDGLNTLCPVGQGRYFDLRRRLAIPASAALPIARGYGLHPALRKLKLRYDAGRVAIVRGVGYSPPDLSHFNSAALWQQGWGGAAQGYPTGWVGRWFDGLPNASREPLYGVTVGSSVPLHLVGRVARGSALPGDVSGAFGTEVSERSDQRMYDTVASFGDGGMNLGRLANLVGTTEHNLMTLTKTVKRAYAGGFPKDWFGHQMVLCARLVNANLGIRVLDTRLSGFDTHTGQPATHRALLASLDTGIDQFFAALSDTWRRRVIVVVTSEFGRRPEENDGDGTDHGTANVALVIGSRVAGGLHGRQPLLGAGDLDPWGNLRPRVDFRSLYSTILDRWLAADSREILGRSYDHLGIFASTP